MLVGSDSGATLAATLLGEVDADAAVIAGLALPGSSLAGSWSDEVDARTACPVHRSVLDADPGFDRGALERPVPWDETDLRAPDKPVLVLHGGADRVTPAAAAVAAYAGSPAARVWVVEGGRHDVLNDATHRSVAATVVLFLESLRLGPHLPAQLVLTEG